MFKKLPSTINLVEVGFQKGFLTDKYIEINGVVSKTPDTFHVYLMEDGELYKTADMPFVFISFHTPLSTGPRVELNNWVKSKLWGRQENYHLPFKTGLPFVLEFIAAPNNTIIIYVDDRHFATFSRVNLSNISQLYIAGGDTIKVNSMTLCTKILPTTTPAKPPPVCLDQIELNNLKIPSIINLKAQFGLGFAPPKRIIIVGTPTASTRFIINLANDGVPEDTADIPFHFSADFAKKEVIRDTWVRGTGWIRKETSGGLPFKVGQSFELEFRSVHRNGLQVSNFCICQQQIFVSFNRYDMSKITQMEIKGAIDVSFVVLCK
uniref:Galectin n=1 Tax=Meloidogyne enterolobii TaxID=390850 RepID=A0A6V7WBK4_MELEN|nr:unnamed protein product [Meloidogyne enterolobii]